MRKLIFIILTLPLLFSCNGVEKTTKNNNTKEISQAHIEQEVWTAIESRFNSWKDNDFETYMNYYHPSWKRWSSEKDQLMTKQDIANFWDIMKKQEECLEMKITPIAIEVLDGGKSAIAHYTHTESFRYHGEDKPDGRKKGNIFKGTLRWSDFMVKENDKWLVLGGHRDMTKPEGKLVQLKN